MQAEIVKQLTLQGFNVVVFNQRSIKEILRNILVIGSIIDKQKEAEKLVRSYERRIDLIREKSIKLKYHPKVYFEEWYDPLISGICWVSELIEIAGGREIFQELRDKKSGKERIVTPEEVIRRNPDIIVGSWCGKQFKKNIVKSRKSWNNINAVRDNKLYEIKSSLILQPGPAALGDGLDELIKIIHNY